jgi:hypothetical protein
MYSLIFQGDKTSVVRAGEMGSCDFCLQTSFTGVMY